MDNELTNLLPPERQRALSRDYLLRLGVVAAVLATALFLSAWLLLIPSYVFLTRSAAAKEDRLAGLEAVLSTADEKALSVQLAALSSDAAVLTALGKTPSASATIRAALSVSRPGVVLSGLSYAPAAGKTPRTLALSGIAVTRDALRTYQLALQSAPFAVVANLPVSAYAKDSDIPFTITVTLSP